MILLSSATIADGLPRALADQPWVQAIAYAISRQTAAALEALPKTHSWTGLADAPDAVLDTLAAELHARGYDQSYTAARKREIIAGAFNYWAHAGTVASVEDVLLSTFGAQSYIEDWYMYDSEPGYFRITTTDPSIAGDALARFKSLAEDVKRLSAWLEAVNVNATLPITNIYLAALMQRGAVASLESERLIVDLANGAAQMACAALLLRDPAITLATTQPT